MESLVLGVRETSGTGISQVWFEVLRCLGGGWSSVWRGIQHSHMDAPRSHFMERRGGVLFSEDPVSPDPQLVHQTASRWYSTAWDGAAEGPTRAFEESERYAWDSELARFVPDDGTDTAGTS